MKILQIIIIALFVTSFLTLTGCEEPKGYLELKEPMPDLKDMPQGKDWLSTPITEHFEETTEVTTEE